jgi:hypothetical protein
MMGNDGAANADALEAITDPRLKRFLAYLEAKRGDRPFAARRDIDPAELTYILPQMLLIDVLHEPLRFRYRLVGTGLVTWRGYDLTGKPVDDHPLPKLREQALLRYRETVERRVATGGTYDIELDGRRRRYQTVRVPLSEDGKTINMLAIASVFEG